MQSKVSVRGQTVIPQEIRDRLGIRPETKISWSTREGVLIGVPVADNPFEAVRGILKGRGPTSADVIAEREADLALEERGLRRSQVTRPKRRSKAGAR